MACCPRPMSGSSHLQRQARRWAARGLPVSLHWRRLQGAPARRREHRSLGATRALCRADRDGARPRRRHGAAGPPPARPGRDLPAAGAARCRCGGAVGHAARSAAQRHHLGAALAGAAARGHRSLRAAASPGLRPRPQQRRRPAGAQPAAPERVAAARRGLRTCRSWPGRQRAARAGSGGLPEGTGRPGPAGAPARPTGRCKCRSGSCSPRRAAPTCCAPGCAQGAWRGHSRNAGAAVDARTAASRVRHAGRSVPGSCAAMPDCCASPRAPTSPQAAPDATRQIDLSRIGRHEVPDWGGAFEVRGGGLVGLVAAAAAPLRAARAKRGRELPAHAGSVPRS